MTLFWLEQIHRAEKDYANCGYQPSDLLARFESATNLAGASIKRTNNQQPTPIFLDFLPSSKAIPPLLRLQISALHTFPGIRPIDNLSPPQRTQTIHAERKFIVNHKVKPNSRDWLNCRCEFIRTHKPLRANEFAPTHTMQHHETMQNSPSIAKLGLKPPALAGQL